MPHIGELEQKLFLHPDETRKEYIIDLFEQTQSFHLPVVKDGDLQGLICIFDVIRAPTSEISIADYIQTDCYVAGKEPGVFSFKLKGQSIIPFVDSDGKFITFMNKVTSKCYIPSNEYIKLIESSLVDEDSLPPIEEPFDALIEENEDCIYVTLKKGQTISINNNATLLHNVHTLEELTSVDLLKPLDSKFQKLSVRSYQNVQSRKELTLYRIDKTTGNDIATLHQDLLDMERLANTYKEQLSLLRTGEVAGKKVISRSEKGKSLYKTIMNIAHFDSSVLLLGESGVGKSLFASIIHQHSQRKDEPFMVIDCASLPNNLLESELFGYETGSFTGAKKGGKIGLVELADRGTLFLDEISELPFELQGKLLQLIQEKRFYRIGGDKAIPVDIRIITATNRNLQEMVKNKTFRQDLYYRINVIPITIPALRERKEDIIPLVDSVLDNLNKKYHLEKTLHPSTYRALVEYTWPGNIRELENVLEYMFVTSAQHVIYPDSFKFAQGTTVLSPEKPTTVLPHSFEEMCPLKEAVQQFEKEYLAAIMDLGYNIKELSEILLIDQSTLRRKLHRYELL